MVRGLHAAIADPLEGVTEEEQEVIEVRLGGNPSQWPLGLDGHQHSGAQAEGAKTTVGRPQQGTEETVAQQGALAKVSGPPLSEQPPAMETSQLGSVSCCFKRSACEAQLAGPEASASASASLPNGVTWGADELTLTRTPNPNHDPDPKPYITL